MARYQFQLISSMLLLVILVAQTAAGAPRRLRYQRQRQLFARQEVQPTPYPSAEELKPEQPALIYGPPPSTDLDELPVEEEPAVNSFQPDVDPETVANADAEELDTDENSLEVTTPTAADVPARLRSSRQRFAKLRLAKSQTKRQRQRIARLEELPVEVPAAVAPVPVAAPIPTPQFYYVGAQQPYVVAYSAAPQQLAW